MKTYRYVTLDPTGNITCLVLDAVAAENKPRVTAALMERCEQVGYLEKPRTEEARARLTMMGGEFCGNASMGTAAWLAREDGLAPGEKAGIQLEVSGAENVLKCRITAEKDGFTGEVGMPRALSVERNADGSMTEVRMEGITHLIRTGGELTAKEAEALLLREAEKTEADALGLLQWDREKRFMRPLVWVRKTGTLVWETGCGSGTAAIGAAEALENGNGTTVTEVNQPGGRAEVTVTVKDGRAAEILLKGTVRIREEETVTV